MAGSFLRSTPISISPSGPSSSAQWARNRTTASGSKLPMVDPGKNPTRFPGEPGGGLAEIFARDVDRHIGGRRLERLQEDAHLAAGTAAQFHEPAMRAEMRRDRAGIFLEDRDLGAGQIVFRNLTDLLEQGRAAHIVEEFARQRLRVLSEPGEHRVAKILLARRQIVKGEDAAIHPYRSSARRSPENAQRAEGGKKLR